jgi:aminomethyltransferase
MPVMYDSINAEHLRVRNSVGLFDLTHMGEFELTGPGARDYVQKFVTNDLSKLVENQVMYTCMCFENGGIVDDLLVYNLKDRMFLVVNASNIAKDFAHIEKHKPANVKLTNLSDQTALLAIQGPLAEKVMRQITDYPLETIKYYHAAIGKIAGETMLFSRTGYTGEDGFELYFPNALGPKMWDAVYGKITELGGGAVGLGARDSLRLEMKMALYGNDISENTNPLEAGLGWVTKLDKGDFIGRDALIKIKEKGLTRKLAAFEMEDKAFPRQHYPILAGGKQIGEVTSGIISPCLNKGIGMGYVPPEYSDIGNKFEIGVRGQGHPAVVVKPPFYKTASHK